MKILIEFIGWAAAAMMLAAYLLLTSGRLSSKSGLYQWMNVLSGAGFIVNSGWNGAYPSAFLNVIWMAIESTASSQACERDPLLPPRIPRPAQRGLRGSHSAHFLGKEISPTGPRAERRQAVRR